MERTEGLGHCQRSVPVLREIDDLPIDTGGRKCCPHRDRSLHSIYTPEMFVHLLKPRQPPVGRVGLSDLRSQTSTDFYSELGLGDELQEQAPVLGRTLRARIASTTSGGSLALGDPGSLPPT